MGESYLAKSSRKQIEADEQKLITELKKNSRESIDRLAKNCGFSRQKAWRIIKNLEENKTLWGYTTIVDQHKQGVKHFILLLKAKHLPVDNKIEKNIVDRTIDKLGEKIGVVVEDSHWLHGSYDGMLFFSAPDIHTAKKFYELFNITYEEGIAELELMESIVTVKRNGFINPSIEKTKKLL